MKPFDVFMWQPPGWNAPHPAVIVSHPLRTANKDFVEVVLCTTQRASRAPEHSEVLLDTEDGLDWEHQGKTESRKYSVFSVQCSVFAPSPHRPIAPSPLAPTLQRFNASTLQPFNPSTIQPSFPGPANAIPKRANAVPKHAKVL
jgi:hypothetical protein